MKHLLLAGLMICCLCLPFASVQALEAATVTYLVDTTIDSNAPAYQVCTGDVSDCSLRGAITKANNGVLTDTYQITIPAGTYILNYNNANPPEDSNASGDLDILASIQLVGENSATTIIDAGDFGRVLEHLGSKPLTISGLTLRNGTVPINGGGGGGIRIDSSGSTTISRSVIEDNIVQGDDTLNDIGGGIAVISGTLVIEDSIIQDNQSFSAGGIFAGGGNLSISDTTISGNQVSNSYGLGGGIRQETAAVVDLERCIISGNIANNGGGFSSNLEGQVMMTDTLFTGNHGDYGGGAFIQNLASMERVSFITNNSYYGGGINVSDSTGSLEFTNGTIAGNTAFQGGGVALIDASQVSFIHATLAWNILNPGGTGSEILADYYYWEGSFSLYNSILSSNYPNNACFINVDLIGFTSQGYNIGSDNTCRLTQPSDLPATDALLTGIRLYRYHAYLTPGAGSPAIDAADPASLIAFPIDQRGRLRIDGDLNGSIVADIGAIEYYPFSVFIAFLQK